MLSKVLQPRGEAGEEDAEGDGQELLRLTNNCACRGVEVVLKCPQKGSLFFYNKTQNLCWLAVGLAGIMFCLFCRISQRASGSCGTESVLKLETVRYRILML